MLALLPGRLGQPPVIGEMIAGIVFGTIALDAVARASPAWAGAIGAPMNAGGLMELIVMKVGLDTGVIGTDIFTMSMVMAVATTLMTSPMPTLFLRRAPAAATTAVRETP